MRLLIEILFEILKRCLKASLCVALLAGQARADDAPPRPVTIDELNSVVSNANAALKQHAERIDEIAKFVNEKRDQTAEAIRTILDLIKNLDSYNDHIEARLKALEVRCGQQSK